MSKLSRKYFAGNNDMISSNAWVVSGSRGMVGDIIEQSGENSFLVKTDEGTSRCRLVSKLLGPGQMTITATHRSRGTFNVIKITDTHVTHPDGTTYEWVVGASNAHDNTVGVVTP